MVSPIHASWRAGEAFLEDLVGATTKGVDKQVWQSTQDLRVIDNQISQTISTGVGRYLDALVDDVAHEAKAGWVRWSARLETQIRKDGLLVRSADSDLVRAHWHFLPSGRSNTVGADTKNPRPAGTEQDPLHHPPAHLLIG